MFKLRGRPSSRSMVVAQRVSAFTVNALPSEVSKVSGWPLEGNGENAHIQKPAIAKKPTTISRWVGRHLWIGASAPDSVSSLIMLLRLNCGGVAWPDQHIAGDFWGLVGDGRRRKDAVLRASL